MNLDFDETQLMLRTQARDFISEKSPSTLVKEVVLTEQGYSPEVWSEMADLGWMSIPFAEEYGGAEMTFFEVLLILEEMGRGSLPGPYLSTMLCGMVVSKFGSQVQKERYLPEIISGEKIFALAMTEPSAGLKPGDFNFKATKGLGSKYALTGTKLFCPDAHIADYFLVIARTSPATTDDDTVGISLFITPAKGPGVIVYPQDSIAFDNQSQIELVNQVVGEEDMVGNLDRGWSIVEQIISWGAIAKCAEMIGAMGIAFEMSLDYAKERVQYGKSIGTYQKQQHRLADMWIALEGCRNFFYEVGWQVGNGENDPLNISSAKAMISDLAEELADQATLLHGAIGLTWDYDLGLLFRRIRGAALMFGDRRYHRDQIVHVLESQTK